MKIDNEFNIRLYMLSIVVGLFSGLFSVLFRYILVQLNELRIIIYSHGQSFFTYLIIIVGIWVILLIADKLKNAIAFINGSGIPQSRAVILGKFDFRHPFIQMIAKFIGSLSVIGVGLSVGHGGPCAQIGALGATLISKVVKSNPIEKRYLTIAGTGAGFAGAFTTPIAATIFIIEEITGWFSVKILIPTLLACVISGYCANLILPTNSFSDVKPFPPDMSIVKLIILLTVMSFIFAILGKLFNYLLLKTDEKYVTIKIPKQFKLLIISSITFCIGYFFFAILSGGQNELSFVMRNDNISIISLFFMTLILFYFTILSYSTELYGSLFFPLIVIGGLWGKIYSLILIQMELIIPSNSIFFVLIGMSLMLISCVRAPVSSLILVLEITTHYIIFFPMIFSGGICFLFGQMFGLKHIYHKIYDELVSKNMDDYEQVIFEINYDSVLIDKRAYDIPLFLGSKIVCVNGNKLINKNDKLKILSVGDMITVRIPREHYEELFKIYRALSNE